MADAQVDQDALAAEWGAALEDETSAPESAKAAPEEAVIARDLLASGKQHFLRGGYGSCSQLNERDDHLAPTGILAPHDDCIGDARVAEQDTLDLGRVNVLAA